MWPRSVSPLPLLEPGDRGACLAGADAGPVRRPRPQRAQLRGVSDPVAAVAEASATGETAAIFADIRAVYGVGVVNLIWRHLATFPGALPWAWGTVRPLYVDGRIAREAAAVRAARRLPLRAGAAAGGAGGGRAGCDGAGADHAPCWMPMSGPIRWRWWRWRCCAGPGWRRRPGGPGRARRCAPEAAIPLPPLLRLEAMAPETAALVLRLNGLGAGPEPILASMYRTLAHWPPYLALAWTLLAPLEGLPATIAEVLALAQSRAAGLHPAAAVPLPEAQRPAVRAAIDRFSGDAIARMVVLCGTLRRAMPT